MSTRQRITYPPVGATVTVVYASVVNPGEFYTYTGTVSTDRYPSYSLSVGELRIPWTQVERVVIR